MKRFIVNYAGAWLSGFATSDHINFNPVWSDAEGRIDFGENATAIIEALCRAGIPCQLVHE